jgi:hypothetical protein
VTDAAEHLSDLVGLPLPDHDAPPRVHPGRRWPHQRERLRRHALPLEHRAAGQVRAVRLVRHPLDLGVVLAQHAVARVRHAQRQLAVVGKQHEPFRVEVEAADRKDPLRNPSAHEVEDGRSPLGIVRGSDASDRLVEQQVAQRLGGLEALAVELDRVGGGIGLVTKGGGPPVDRDPALANHRFRIAPRAHPGAGDELLDPFKGQWRLPR